MNDAEIAATLLNRWQRSARADGSIQQAVDLLREGGLSFRPYKGVAPETSDDFTDGAHVECLTFDDGSRILRLMPRGGARMPIGWAAAAPLFDDCDQSACEGMR